MKKRKLTKQEETIKKTLEQYKELQKIMKKTDETINVPQNLSLFQPEKKRQRLEKIVGPLPSNYFNLSSSDQNELFKSRLIKRAEELEDTRIKLGRDYRYIDTMREGGVDYNSTGRKDNKEGSKVEPETEMTFFHWVLAILFWGLFFWLLISQGGCPDVGGGGPIRR